jgi:hypothetical protein
MMKVRVGIIKLPEDKTSLKNVWNDAEFKKTLGIEESKDFIVLLNITYTYSMYSFNKKHTQLIF